MGTPDSPSCGARRAHPGSDIPRGSLHAPVEETFYSSPRRGQLHAAATTTLEEHRSTAPDHKWRGYEQPLQLVLQTFVGMSERDEAFWRRSVPFFRRREIPAGGVLYSTGDAADGFYLLETGILKARYQRPQGSFSEVIVAGATCGELPFFSQTLRTSTTLAERDSVAWVLDRESWNQLQEGEPEVAQELLKIGLKLTSERMNAITRAVPGLGLFDAGPADSDSGTCSSRVLERVCARL